MRKILYNLYKLSLFKRIIPSFLKIYIQIFKKNEIVIKHREILLNLNLLNPIDREIFLRDKYEEEQLNYLSKIIDDKKIQHFLDIGAHMGYYSVNLAKKKISIIAFEPIKKNFEQLKKNKSLNKLENLEIYNFALSNKKKDIIIQEVSAFMIIVTKKPRNMIKIKFLKLSIKQKKVMM